MLGMLPNSRFKISATERLVQSSLKYNKIPVVFFKTILHNNTLLKMHQIQECLKMKLFSTGAKCSSTVFSFKKGTFST